MENLSIKALIMERSKSLKKRALIMKAKKAKSLQYEKDDLRLPGNNADCCPN